MNREGGGNIQISVSRMEQSLKEESWKSQLGARLSLPAHRPRRALCMVMISSPSAPAAALTAAYCQEVGQKPTSLFLCGHTVVPTPMQSRGKPLNGGCEITHARMSRVACPGIPL